MTQRTHNIISYALLSVAALFVVAFVVQHFMPVRPSWHNDLVWGALAFVMVSEILRGWVRLRTRQTLD